MEHDQRHGRSHRTQATAGRSRYVHGFGRGDYFRKIHRDRVRDGHLDIRVANRGEAGRDATHARQTRWKAHADIGPRIAVKRSVLARHGIRLSAAIEGRADPGEIEPGEVVTGGWIGTLQEHICCTSLTSGICRSLSHLSMRPYLC